MTTQIKAFAPATVANVACAFDILGFALDAPGDIVTASFIDEAHSKVGGSNQIKPNQITIVQSAGDAVPLDPAKNTAGASVALLLHKLNEKRAILLDIQKGLPIGSGLGSSAATSAAALVAVNALLGSPLQKRELLSFAIESERVACGSAHPDNVVPSILGGCTLIRSVDPLDVIEIPTPKELAAIVVTPRIELRTEDARKILNQEIRLNKIVTQLGNVAGLVAAFYREDYELLARSLNDVLIEPQRSLLIPGFDAVKKTALNKGALGCSISGSGPTVFAFAKSSDKLEVIKAAMIAEFKEAGVEATGIISGINGKGAVII